MSPNAEGPIWSSRGRWSLEPDSGLEIIEMKLAKQIAFTFSLALAACAGASAQDAAGKFNVTHNARWGTAVLHPGSYSVAVHSGPVSYVVVTPDDRSSVSIMAVAQYIDSATCKSSSLELEHTDGGWNVRSLCFESQLTTYFGSAEKLSHRATPEVVSLSESR